MSAPTLAPRRPSVADRDDSPLALVRADLRDFGGYRSARSESLQGRVWLNANESPWPNPADGDGAARRYPDPQPASLRGALASLYGCEPRQLLASRGSDEGIDLLIRALCRPGGDAMVVMPPTFGMYAVCARLHGTRVVDVPLRDGGDGFTVDFEAVAAAVEIQGAKLVFLCSPGNPTGNLLPLDAIAALARRLRGQAMVVVDEAYVEYAQATSAISLLATERNIAVLRTLSKAHALASARVGSVVADPELIAVLARCQAPYPLPGRSVGLACEALSDPSLATTRAGVDTVLEQRDVLLSALESTPGVRRVYPSRANFLLVRFDDPQSVFDRLLAAAIVVRDMRATPGLEDALRITIGSVEQNAQVIAVLQGSGVMA